LIGTKDNKRIPSESNLALTLTVQVVHSEPDVARKTRLLRHKILLALDLQKDVIAFGQLGLASIAALIIFVIAVVTTVVVTSVILVVIRIVTALIILVVRAALIISVVRAALIIFVVGAAPIIFVVRAALIISVVRAAFVFVVVAVAIRLFIVFVAGVRAAKLQLRLFTTNFRCILDYRCIEIVGFKVPWTFYWHWHSNNFQNWFLWCCSFAEPLSWCR
jgi:hypothetical protein